MNHYMNLKRLGTLIAMAGMFPVWLYAQTPEQKRHILEQTNVAVLQELEARFAERAHADYQAALERAREEDWPLQYLDENGHPVQLVGLNALGGPRYVKAYNLDAAQSTRTDRVWPSGGAGYSLTGKNMTIGVWDGGKVLETHREFGNRVQQRDNSQQSSFHATHVTGTIVAEGIDSDAQGMAYEADADVYDWFRDDSEMASAAANGMLISNHSYGNPAGWEFDRSGNRWLWYGNEQIDSTEDFQFGYYNFQASNWDQIAENAPYYLIVKSAGNDRTDALPSNVSTYYLPQQGFTSSTKPRDPDGDYDCLPTRSNAKNILTVGATRDVANYTGPNSVNMTGFSSWGPTDDGRVKPDIVGNGSSVYSTSDAGTSSYSRASGTSMSSPNVAGSLLLLQEHYHDLNNQYMRAATLKGLALHTADEAGSPGPDYVYGWGLLNTQRAADAIADSTGRYRISERTLNDGDTLQQSLYANGQEPLRVTISWTDPAASAQSPVLNNRNAIVLINDLDIQLVHQNSNTIYQPYVLDPDNPTSDATRGDNDVDNVEQIYIDNPPAGTYTIRVFHEGNLDNLQPQDFAMITEGFYGTPQPNFRVSRRNVCLQEQVQFTNLTGGATQFKWYFPGASPDSSTAENPQVQYDQSGSYDVRLEVTNTLGTQVVVRENFITVEPDNNGVAARNIGASASYIPVANNGASKLIYDPQTQSLAFIHSDNFAIGSSGGALLLDYSKDGGQTWVTNYGPLNNNQAPLPFFGELASYNPQGNTHPDSLRLILSSALFDNGYVGLLQGVQPLDTLKSRSLLKKTPRNNDFHIPQGLTQSRPGVYWLADEALGDTSNALIIYRGVYDPQQDTIGFSEHTRFRLSVDSANNSSLAGWQIDFDPSGRYGWAVITTQLRQGPPDYPTNYPVTFYTSDSGKTWSGPHAILLDSLQAVQNQIVGNEPYAAPNYDMTVDSAGQLHMALQISPQTGTNVNDNQPSSLIHVYGDTANWRSRLLGERRRFFRRVGQNNIRIGGRPQVSRSADGRVITFAWVSESGAGVNYDPQLLARAYSVRTHKYSRAINFTRCQSGQVNGGMFFMTAADQLKESATHWSIPMVISAPRSGNFTAGVQHRYVDSIRFDKTTLDYKAPVAQFDVPVREACINDVLTLVDQSREDVTRWTWILPGSRDSIYANANPEVQYVRSGTHDVTLIAQGPAGTDTLTRAAAVTIRDTPRVRLTAPPLEICVGDSVQIEVNTQGSVRWTPSLGLSSTVGKQVWASPNTDRTYRVQVTENGCVSRESVDVTVGGDEPISSNLSADVYDGCDSLTVQFEGRTNGGKQFEWTFEGADPETRTGQNPRVTYREPGLFDVRLKVDDGCGREDITLRANLILIEASPKPQLSPASDTLVNPGDTITIQAEGPNGIRWLDGPYIVERNGARLQVAPEADEQFYEAVGQGSICPDDTARIRVITDPALNIASNASQKAIWSIYPNPVRDELKVQFEGADHKAAIHWRILSLTGREVRAGLAQSRSFSVFLEDLPRGVYNIQIRRDQAVVNRKLMLR